MGTKKQRFSPPALGGTSLLVVFAVLCLTIFALLSLTTVQADVRLADASAKAVEAYYAADCQAQEILARIRNGEEPGGVHFTGGRSRLVEYAVPITETQELQVEVRLEDGTYVIERWQAVSTGEWSGNEALDVWDGDTNVKGAS